MSNAIYKKEINVHVPESDISAPGLCSDESCSCITTETKIIGNSLINNTIIFAKNYIDYTKDINKLH